MMRSNNQKQYDEDDNEQVWHEAINEGEHTGHDHGAEKDLIGALLSDDDDSLTHKQKSIKNNKKIAVFDSTDSNSGNPIDQQSPDLAFLGIQKQRSSSENMKFQPVSSSQSSHYQSQFHQQISMSQSLGTDGLHQQPSTQDFDLANEYSMVFENQDYNLEQQIKWKSNNKPLFERLNKGGTSMDQQYPYESLHNPISVSSPLLQESPYQAVFDQEYLPRGGAYLPHQSEHISPPLDYQYQQELYLQQQQQQLYSQQEFIPSQNQRKLGNSAGAMGMVTVGHPGAIMQNHQQMFLGGGPMTGGYSAQLPPKPQPFNYPAQQQQFSNINPMVLQQQQQLIQNQQIRNMNLIQRGSNSMPLMNQPIQAYNFQHPQLAQPFFPSHMQQPPLYANPNMMAPMVGSSMPSTQTLSYGRTSNISQKSNSSSTQLQKPFPQNSPFVEEFKIKLATNKEINMADLKDHYVECSLDQQCSRFIQQKLEDASDDEKQLLFVEILQDSQRLMKDVFGNYVIQKMFDYGNLNQRGMLYRELKGNMLDLSKDQYGCRVVQKALEVLTTAQQDDLIDEIKPLVNICVEDANGNHVIQKIVEQIQSPKIQFIVDSFHQKVYEMSVHQFGCRVIQRMLEHCQEEQLRPILEEVYERVLDLTKDMYGNYVISHVLEHGSQADKLFVISKIKKRVMQLSTHKFGSNVIEKCLVHGEKKQKDDIIGEILQAKLTDEDNHSNRSHIITLQDLMKDKYGNYVIQRIIDICSENQRKQLIDKILKVAQTMKKHKSHARHVFNFLEKNYNISIVFAEDEEKKSAKKTDPQNQRRSQAQKQTRASELAYQQQRSTNSCLEEQKGGQRKSKGQQSNKQGGRKGKLSSVVNMDDQSQEMVFEVAQDTANYNDRRSFHS